MLSLVVTVPTTEVELASDALWALGVVAIEERDIAAAGGPGFVELWTSLGDDAESVTAAADGFPDRWRWRLAEVDPAVADTWRAHAAPTWITDDLVIVPAWVAPPPAGAQPVTAITIEPGATFGLGDHPTTVLSLRALLAVVQPGVEVLDVGCGSGVLAVTACTLGARRAVAIDLSPAAVPVTAANAARNEVADRVEVSTAPLSEVTGEFGVVVANILAPVLVELAPDLIRSVASGGSLVVSGLLATRYGHVVEALAPLEVVDRLVLDGWTALTLRR